MEFPPLSYFLLFVVTIAATPFLLRRARSDVARLFARRFLAGLLSFELGLILLFYAKILCWPLVALGAGLIASAGLARRPRAAFGLLLVPGVVAGLAFQVLPGTQAYLFYFGFGLPFLVTAAVALAVARPAASGRPGSLLAAAAILVFAAFVPASALGFSFLVQFEIYHLPFLGAALAGLWVLTRDTPALLGGRPAVPGTIAERLASPWRTRVVFGAPFVLAGLAVGALALRHAPLPGIFRFVAWGGFAVAGLLAVLLVAGVLRQRSGLVLLVAGLVGAAGGLLGVRFGAEAFFLYVGGGPAPETVYFYLAVAGSFFLVLAAGLGVARELERAERGRLASRREHLIHPRVLAAGWLPRGFVVERVPRVPTTTRLADFREQVRRAGAIGGVLEVTEEGLDPLAGLPYPVAAWLDAQETFPLVHLAVREGQEVFLVPFIDPQEGA